MNAFLGLLWVLLFAFLFVVGVLIVERIVNRDKYAEYKKKRAARKAERWLEDRAERMEAGRKKLEEEREARNRLTVDANGEAQRPIDPKKHVDEITKSIVNAHVKTLYRKKLQGVRKDDYGNIFDEGWVKEKQYFHDHVVVPQVSKRISLGQVYDPFNIRRTSSFIEEAVLGLSQKQIEDNFDINILTPYEFEAYCAELLNRNGWSARTTAGSGDQGIDIIAEKDGVRAVFQVKKYTSPVGNKAVQEIIAGRVYASADMAFVVTNTSFTPSAKALADASGVGLLHYGELEFLDP